MDADLCPLGAPYTPETHPETDPKFFLSENYHPEELLKKLTEVNADAT